MGSERDQKLAQLQIMKLVAIETVQRGCPGLEARGRRNPGLKACEKLAPMEPEPEKAASNLHMLMMSCMGGQVK